MKKIFEVIFLIFVGIKGYSQISNKSDDGFLIHCDSNRITFIDSIGKEIKSNQTQLVYNGIEVNYLGQLNDVDFIKLIGARPYVINNFNLDKLYNVDHKNLITNGHKGLKAVDSTLKYCVRCMESDIKIIDSIDINLDGVKELFVYRKWDCNVTPSNVGPYGEGEQRLVCGRYEVWDIKSKNKIFEVKNMLFNSMAVTTNTFEEISYKFEVNVSKSGTILISKFSGDIIGNIPELGTYNYDITRKVFKRE